ncbi:MAG: SprT family zinc-dependent metalloprotease [Ekhidna sp.]|uniref:M48 family metallopeptidase n=1 Tax=Ekhidna sp. TaxID=2608089 RepID=UPI00329893E6
MSEIVNKKIKFGSKTIVYGLEFKERKSLGIKVYPDCSVKVIAPLESTEDLIKKKIKEKAPWIITQQNEFLSYHPLTPPRKYLNGETHLYLGRQYRLKTDISVPPKTIKLLHGRILVPIDDPFEIKILLEKWYRKQAKFHFKEVLGQQIKLFNKYDISPNPPLHIQSMPTRWGSCTPRGKIIMNPELIKAPKGCIEYVVVHELCHLIHHNHTRAFYDLQESILPDWKKWKQKLEKTLI